MEDKRVFDPYLGAAKRVPNLDEAIPDYVDEALLARRDELADDVRDTVTNLFQRLTGIPTGVSWAIYNAEPKTLAELHPGMYPDISSDPESEPERELCFIMINDGSKGLPLLRIFAMEDVCAGGREQRLTEDFTLDFENDAQYFMGAKLDESAESKSNRESYAATFAYVDGSIKVFDYFDFTGSVPVNAAADPDNEIAPFGFCEELQDQIDALEQAKGLLAEITYMDPVHFGTQESLAA